MNNIDISKSKEQLIVELNNLRAMNIRLKKEKSDMEDHYKMFDDYFSMKERLQQAEQEIRELKEELALRRKVDGRPSRFSQKEKQEIRNLRRSGMAINKIAEKYNCSSSVIHSIVKDIKVDLRRNSTSGTVKNSANEVKKYGLK